MKLSRVPTLLVLPCLLFAATTHVAFPITIAHWTFENTPGFLADSAGSNGLTNEGGVTQVASPFTDPVPGTGASNEFAASFSGANYLTAPDNAAFTSNQLTLEAFFTTGSVTGTDTRLIAGHFGSGTTGGTFQNQRSFALGVRDSQIRFLLGSSSGTATVNTDAFTLTANTHYYVAAAVDVTNSGSNAVTLYLKNLTLNSDLAIANAPRGAVTSLFNASAPFSIGSTAQGSALFTGTIDEVRLSNVKLSPNELLIVPEPTSAILLAISLGCGLFLRRRRSF